jgi:hypothetical protein
MYLDSIKEIPSCVRDTYRCKKLKVNYSYPIIVLCTDGHDCKRKECEHYQKSKNTIKESSNNWDEEF